MLQELTCHDHLPRGYCKSDMMCIHIASQHTYYHRKREILIPL